MLLPTHRCFLVGNTKSQVKDFRLRLIPTERAKEAEKENPRGGEDLNPRPRDLESRALPN